MDSTLKKYKLLRTPVRAKITKLKNNATEVLNEDSAESLRKAEILLMCLQGAIQELKELDLSIVNRLAELNETDSDMYGESLLEEEISKNSEIDDKVEDIIAAINAKFSTKSDDSTSLHSHCSYKTTLKGPKLTSIKMPKFTGDILSWQTFWDTFRANVHDNDQYAMVVKMAFLKDHVVGEAAEALQHLYITDNCYDQAIDLLKSRFEREQDVKYAHMLELLNMTPASKPAELRSVIDKTEGHLRCLTALGFCETDNAELFTCVLLSKLPERLRADLTRRKGPSDWTLRLLREMLADEVRALDSFKLTSGFKPKEETKPISRGSATRTMTTQALVSNNRKPLCEFCKGTHYSDQCRTHETLEDRKRQSIGACFRCLKRSHKLKDCQSKKKCFFCKQNSHHSALCPDKFSRTESSINSSSRMEYVQVFSHLDEHQLNTEP